jgi:predicted Zn-dependent protease
MEFKTEKWSRIKELFEAALDVEPSSRGAFLEKEAGSAELRSAVEELLNANEDAGSFLQSRDAFAVDSPDGFAPHRLEPGTLLVDRFEIRRFISRGGMGEVYEARDLELQTPVAIKTIRPEIAGSPQALARFKQEVHLAKQVTHPNVCRIFDLFRHRDSAAAGNDVVFISMELLRGNTLWERLKETGRMSPGEVEQILRQIVPALGAAHAAGILHRDLKPSNILLEPSRDGNVRAVITDFGLARSLDSNSEAVPTRSGQIGFGTPEYMSPEQIEGKQITPASDFYSLGLVIYQMVTGARVFAADTPLFSALRRLKEAPPPPSRIVPGIGAQWDALIAGCLNPDPAQRFSSARQIIELLDGKMGALARSQQIKHAAPAAKLWVFRHRRLTAVLLAGILLGSAALLFWRWKHQPSADADLTFVLADFVNTTGEPAFDNTLNVALAAKLQQSPFLNQMPDAKIRLELRYMGLTPQERLTESVARQVCERGGGQAVLQGSIASNAKGYTVTLRAVQCHSGELIAVKQIPVEFRDSVLDGLDQVADDLRPSLGESAASIQKYNVALGEATTGSIEALVAFSQGNLVWNAQGEAAAMPYFERAVAIDPNFAIAYARLGTIYGNMGESQRSLDALSRAFERRDRVTEWERYYITSHYYGFVTGEIDKEMQAYEEWAKAYPHDMAWTVNLSVDYGILGQYDKAIELQRRAIQEIPGLSPSYGDLAQFYLAVDRPDEARSVLDQALDIHVNDVNIQLGEYERAYYLHDAVTMSKLLAAAPQYPGVEDTLLAQQAATEDSAGRLSAGRGFAAKAAEVAAHAGQSEASANWLAGEALRQAEMGATAQAHGLVAKALADPKTSHGSDVQLLSALAAAQSGDVSRARTLLASLAQAHPLDTLIQKYWAPVLRARIAYAEGKFALAEQSLDGTSAYDLGVFSPGQCMDAAFVRGQALLADHQGATAAAEFRSILAHRGLVLNCPTAALAQLDLARSLAQAGDAAGSRSAYQDLFVLWKDADKDFPLLKQAQTEYRVLR